MGSDSARYSAYADLVAGLLDARDQTAEARFDQELADAEASGRIDPDTARILRWWQRETQRALVAHAETVLPPTLLALERSSLQARDRLDSGVADSPTEEPRVDIDQPLDDEPKQPTDLTARRLLVAGLTPLRDP